MTAEWPGRCANRHKWRHSGPGLRELVPRAVISGFLQCSRTKRVQLTGGRMFTVKKTILILAAALFVLPGVVLAQGKGGDKPTGTTTVPVGGDTSLDGLMK